MIMEKKMETTIMGYIGVIVYGWLSKLWSLFGSLIIIRHLIFKDTHKGTIILTTTHMGYMELLL